MTHKEILLAARALIENPAHWTQFAYARDAAEYSVKTDSPAAVRWCAAGAIERECHRSGYWASASDLWYLFAQANGEGISDLNDRSKHPDVLAAFDKAIEALS